MIYPQPIISFKSKEFQKLKEREERERLMLDAFLLLAVLTLAYHLLAGVAL